MVTEVLEYLSSASAGGILGNSSYAAVGRLGIWMREHLGWNGDEVASLPTGPQVDELVLLFADARREWSPDARVIARQTVTVGRDMNAPAINRAGTDK